MKRVAMIGLVVFLVASTASAQSTEYYEKIELRHDSSDGFDISNSTESGTQYIVIHNGHASLQIERDTTLPPITITTYTDGTDDVLEAEILQPNHGFGCAIGYCRFIDLKWKECVTSSCDNGCAVCFASSGVSSTDVLHYGPGPF